MNDLLSQIRATTSPETLDRLEDALVDDTSVAVAELWAVFSDLNEPGQLRAAALFAACRRGDCGLLAAALADHENRVRFEATDLAIDFGAHPAVALALLRLMSNLPDGVLVFAAIDTWQDAVVES